MLTKTKVADKVWAIRADTQIEIGKAFIRFQEYYENADLRGRKDLTVRDIEKWWAQTREKDCKEPYYEYWTGFNIPGRIFLELTMSPLFRTGASVKEFFCNLVGFPCFHKEEDQLLALLVDLSVDEIGSSYFIGLSNSSTDVLDHEMAHAFFALDARYKSTQLYNIGKLPPEIYRRIREDLLSVGYHKDVIHDEIQAYLSTYVDTLKDTFDTDDYTVYTQPFIDAFAAKTNISVV